MIRQGDRFGSWAVVGRYEDSAAFVCRHVDTGSRGLLYVADPSSGLPMAAVQRHAEILGRLQHPVALQVLEVNPREAWVVTELAAGDNLQTKLEGSVVDLADALRMLREVADCLDHAHQAGLYHYQLQPCRIVFWREHIKLLDFSDEQQPPPVTATPPAWQFPYLPPELHKGGKVATADPVQWDLYALGITFYEALTGNRAHITEKQDGEVPPWMVGEKLRTPHLDPGPAFPQQVRRLTMKATALKPKQRFPSAAALRDAALQTEQALAAVDVGMSSRIRGVLRAVLAVLLLTVVGGMGVMFAGMSAEQFATQQTRPVRLIVSADDPAALNRVTVNGVEAAQAVGTSFYFPSVQVGPADVHVTSGKGCGPPYCPGEKCPFCCTGARVTRTIEPGSGEQNLVIPVGRGDSETPRPVLITAPTLPPGVRLEAYLYSADGDPKGVRDPAKGGWHFAQVPPGSYELLVEAGKCSRAAMGCQSTGRCPEGCSSVFDVLLVPCGTGDLEIAVDLVAPL